MVIEIGNTVRHKTAGITGKVVGYGYRKISDSYYLATLKVELGSHNAISPTAEDLFDRWQTWQDRRVKACTLPHFPKHKYNLSKVG